MSLPRPTGKNLMELSVSCSSNIGDCMYYLGENCSLYSTNKVRCKHAVVCRLH